VLEQAAAMHAQVKKAADSLQLQLCAMRCHHDALSSILLCSVHGVLVQVQIMYVCVTHLRVSFGFWP
jgi:hypothetical protein